jgi:hypothetical protein
VVTVAAEEPFGARLWRLREAGGLSRTDLWPRVLTFAALARALGVSMEELLYGEAEAARIARERRSSGRGR